MNRVKALDKATQELDEMEADCMNYIVLYLGSIAQSLAWIADKQENDDKKAKTRKNK